MKYISIFNQDQQKTNMSFTNSSYEKYIALFLSKPENFDKIETIPTVEKQAYFFQRFYKFLLQYKNITPDMLRKDEYLYVTCRQVAKHPIHAFHGPDARRIFQQEQEQRKRENDYLQKKYGFIATDDNRLFLGKRQIWLNPVLPSEWNQIIQEQSYDDETFTAPIPSMDKLDKDLVPLKIRNKVVQLSSKIISTPVKKEDNHVPDIIKTILQGCEEEEDDW
jgi:hypothetical protein